MRNLARVGGGILIAALGLALGFWLGAESQRERLRLEVAGTLVRDIEVLTQMRLRGVEPAVHLIEGAASRAVRTLPEGGPVSKLDRVSQEALGIAKVYAMQYPPGWDADVIAVLADTPSPEYRYCSPTLRDLQIEAADPLRQLTGTGPEDQP
jgi:hypothetical protein